MDDDNDEKDDTKRKSRNLSEKKRRDQFNLLVNELSSIVSANNRKMDKSTVLKSTIAFLKNHNELTVRSRAHEIQEDWKPSFLSNEEFTHLILEALDGFIIVFSSSGRIFYASESVTSLLGYLPTDFSNMTIYDIVYEDDQNSLYNILLNPVPIVDPIQNAINQENQTTFSCHVKRGGLDNIENTSYDLVKFTGYFRSDVEVDTMLSNSRYSGYSEDADTRLIFVGTGRLLTPQLIREMSVVDSSKNEFTSRHSLEWKFLFLDHQAPPIIGYLPFEVLGTSGYDYYHFDDLEKVITCHEALMQKGEGTSCYYRFLTKGQQWIWLQTRFYITYHQWNSKPEFVVCTHRVVSYADVMKNVKNNNMEDCKKDMEDFDSSNDMKTRSATSYQVNSPWSSRSSMTSQVASQVASPSIKSRQRNYTYNGPESDSTSMSASSPASKKSVMAHRTRIRQNSHPARLPSQMQQHHHQSQNTHTQQISSLVMNDEPQRPPLQIPQIITSTFIEPPQYLTAISVQQVGNSNSFPVVTNIAHIPQNTEYLPASLIMTPAQNQIQDELQRKHEELQHLIVQQQDELRRVSEQLLMARYGLLPYPAAENGTQDMRAIVSGLEIENQQQQQQICNSSELIHLQTQQLNSQETPNPSIEQVQLGQEMISYMQLTPVPTSHLLQPTPHHMAQHSSPQHQRQQHQHHSHQLQHHGQQQQHQQHQQMLSTNTGNHQNLETMPYHMSQDHVTTILYSNNMHSPGSTSSMHNN